MDEAELPPNLPLNAELVVDRVGDQRVPSPLLGRDVRFQGDEHGVLVSSDTRNLPPYARAATMPPAFEEAGPRTELFVEPGTVACGIVTCGGLCPGLNDVIRSIVFTLRRTYGVPRVIGYRYGYAGLAPELGHQPMELTLEVVRTIHQEGGTILGSSRGPQDVGGMVDTLVRDGVHVLFCIGGDGTLRGASAIAQEVRRRDLPIAVVGIPKTIDNDLFWIERTFGFATAVGEASRAIRAAHNEARAAWNGVGLVKLMGRHAGFIAAHATLATSDVNFVLIPEVPFTLEGEGGFLEVLERRLAARRHAVIVVAEGAGQDLLYDPARGTDASGNAKLGDIGAYLRDRIRDHCRARGIDSTVKYIDPSYIIRSLPTSPFDSEFCVLLGQQAVHAGLAGRTNLVIGYWHHHFTHLPIALATKQRRTVDPHRETWQRVVEATGQPPSMVGR